MIYTAIRFYNLALEDVKKKAIERNRYFIALHDYSNDDYDSGRADGIREILDFIEKQKV